MYTYWHTLSLHDALPISTVVLGGRVELGESAMQVATALEQFALLGVVFDGDGVDRVILRIAQLQSAYLAHQRRTVSMTAVHAVATEAAPFVIAMLGRRDRKSVV